MPNEGYRSNGGCPRPTTWPPVRPYAYSWIYPYTHHKTTRLRVPPRVRYIPSGTKRRKIIKVSNTRSQQLSKVELETHPLAFALIVVACDHVAIAPHLTPAVYTSIVRFCTIVGTINDIHQHAATTPRADGANTPSSSVKTRAGQSDRVRGYRARDGHTGALKLLMHRTRPIPNGEGRRVWRNVRRVTARSRNRP